MERGTGIDIRNDTMTVGTNLLVQVFEGMTSQNTKQKIVRRLYCESGSTAIKAYRYCSDNVRDILDGIIIPHSSNSKLQTRTAVMVLEELARINKPELLREMYHSMGGPSAKAYKFCNNTTQKAIQDTGLVKGKSQTNQTPGNPPDDSATN